MKTVSDEELAIRANGEPRSVAPGTTVAGFLASHDLNPDLVVVERNARILPRADFDRTLLERGDELEIVHFVGGG
jgi:thiamine biosynthesis protein ThiS